MRAVILPGLGDLRGLLEGGGLLRGLLLFLATWVVAVFARRLINRALERRRLRGDMAILATRVVYLGLVALGAVFFLSAAFGSPNVGLTGVVTAAIVTSLGLQDLFKNYVSGYYILLERNVRVGDRVESQGYRGVVTDVRMRVTYLRGDEGELIVVPNGELFNHTLVVVPASGANAQESAAKMGEASGSEGAQDDSHKGVEVLRP